MNQQLLTALRKELENSFGRKILSSRDCLQLVDDIYQKTGYTINSNTLRRFFGLVKTDYSASPSTVTILSKYCGFGSIDEIEKITSTAPGEDAINREEVMHYLVSLFKNLDPSMGYNKVVNSIVQQTLIFLERNKGLIDRFQREIARIPAGQYYYYEMSVNMDRLDDYYGNGLRHYLRAVTSEESKLFAHAIQVFRYWLTDDPVLLEKHFQEMHAIPVHQHYPSHILGRVIAARLLYAQTRNESIDKVISDAARYHVSIFSSRGNAVPSYPDFELIICEALILTAHVEEAQEYIRRGKAAFAGYKTAEAKHPFSFWENLLHPKKNNLVLPLETSRKATNQEIHSYTYPLNRKYHSLLALQFNPASKPSMVADLIEETGFKKIFKINTRKVENI
jgi:hypothetical protein